MYISFNLKNLKNNTINSLAIRLHPLIAKLILRLNRFDRSIWVMCRGYNEDDENFTGLVWEDDKYLDFSDDWSYPEFQVWINFDYIKYDLADLLGLR